MPNSHLTEINLMAATYCRLGHIRAGLYVTWLLFSLTLFILCIVRSHASSVHYQPAVTQLLCTTLLTVVWCTVMLCTFFLKNRFLQFYGQEFIGLMLLWPLWLGGAIGFSVDLKRWSFRCHWDNICDVQTTILAFAWIGWIILEAMLILCAKGMLQSMHGWHKMFEEQLPHRDEGRVMLPLSPSMDGSVMLPPSPSAV
ncbi:hypothetical protein BT96DRAFT_923627 [Gymnopus androsaceus JB14]|uniref:MARVEL domain-containing protein n=1 Tax=Gymnopus androsaceus JB14 TaxID=1447944 RepID=A0A6A4H7T8_9AGAR|nr:hypothetical protein BT96DRAFT_923627 [Gymnopus androsaceus JB14]